MSATASYLAGAEADQVEISYGLEATWGAAPATTFQAIRSTGESLSGKKNRDRPKELSPTAQASQAVTQSESADGAINFALSVATYDDLIGSLLNNAWSSDLAIVGVSGDISTVATGNHVTSTTSGKFTNAVVGQWVKLSGFTTPANNCWGRVATKASNVDITLSGVTLADETPSGAAAHIKGSIIRNGTEFHSLFIQKKLATSQYLTYAGSQITGLTLNQQQGKYIDGSFNVLSQIEAKATSDSSSGGVVAAPTGRVIDTVTQFQSLMSDGTAITANVNALNLNISKDGAQADYAMGSAAAVGMRIGRFTLSGSLEMFFKDFTYYDKFTNETANAYSYRLVDFAGKSYVVTLPSGTIMNPSIVAGGPGTAVVAKFTLEGNPDAATGVTFQIDRFA